MELAFQEGETVNVLKVQGRINHVAAAAFQEALAPRLTVCVRGAAPLVLDFSGVEYISSVGLRVLMLAARQVKAQGGKIAIVALTPIVADVLRIARFDLVFPIFGDIETATEHLT